MKKREMAACTVAALLVFITSLPVLRAGAATSPEPYSTSVQPFLAKNCYACHNAKLKTADLDLSAFKIAPSVPEHVEEWEKVIARLTDGTMPPKGFPRPKQEDVEAVKTWIQTELTRVEQNTKPDPGQVTARRLNRTEYNNTVRDLLGIEFRPADDFPQDDSGYGFDNIGDVLSLSPVLMEKYMRAAETAVSAAVYGPEKRKPTVLRHQPPSQEFPLLPKALTDYDVTGLSMPNALHATLRFPADGEYTIRVALEGRRPNGSEPVQVGFWIDGKQVHTLNLLGNFDGGSLDLFGAQSEFRYRVPAGDHWIAASLVRLYEGLPPSYGGPNPSKPAVIYFERRIGKHIFKTRP